MMFDVFFDFLIGVVNDGKKSLKKLNKIHRIIAVILYCIEVIILLTITMLTIDDYQMYLERNKNLHEDESIDNKNL